MSLPIEESEFVFCDVQAIVRHLRKRSPSAANRFVAEFRATVGFLASMPGAGRPRPEFGIAGLRSWRVEGFRKHLLFYEELPDRIRVLRVLHGSRDLQAELGGGT
jgi:toxin ParE1/3/4